MGGRVKAGVMLGVGAGLNSEPTQGSGRIGNGESGGKYPTQGSTSQPILAASAIPEPAWSDTPGGRAGWQGQAGLCQGG